MNFTPFISAHLLGTQTDYQGKPSFSSTGTLAIIGQDDGLGWEDGSKTFGIVLGTTGSNRITVSHGSVTKTSLVSRPGAKDIELTIGSVYLWADGVRQTMDVTPYIRDNRTFMPVRFASEALGAVVEWDPDKRQVIITKGSAKIVLTIGSRTMRLNNTNVALDTEPEIVNPGRTMMPIRAERDWAPPSRGTARRQW
jgi:hypothetical protein